MVAVTVGEEPRTFASNHPNTASCNAGLAGCPIQPEALPHFRARNGMLVLHDNRPNGFGQC